MRPCTPTTSAPSATGRQYQFRRRPKRARRQGKIEAGTDTPTPVQQLCTHVQSCDQKRPFLLGRAIAQPSAAPPPYGCGIPLAGTARFSFGKAKEKWGVQWTGYHHSRIPRAAGCRPYTSPKEGPRREPVWEITPPIPPCGPPTTPGTPGPSGRGWV